MNYPPPIGGGKDFDYNYSKTLARLLRRFVRIAVPDQDQIFFSDIEILDTLMRCGSVTKTAKMCGLSIPYVSTRVSQILEQLEQSVSFWEHVQSLTLEDRQISDLEARQKKARQRKAELEAQLNEETADVRDMTLTYAQKRVKDNQVYLRERKNPRNN